jgi:hypothetical protein
MSASRFEPVVSSISQSLGVSDVVAANLISQALSSCIPITNIPTEDWDCIAALLCSLEPSNAIETMVSVQILGLHYHSTKLLSKAATCESLDVKEQALKIAIKVSRHCAALVETLNKLKGKHFQKILVEKVHIHSGGQAIVGHVENSQGGLLNGKK